MFVLMILMRLFMNSHNYKNDLKQKTASGMV